MNTKSTLYTTLVGLAIVSASCAQPQATTPSDSLPSGTTASGAWGLAQRDSEVRRAMARAGVRGSNLAVVSVRRVESIPGGYPTDGNGHRFYLPDGRFVQAVVLASESTPAGTIMGVRLQGATTCADAADDATIHACFEYSFTSPTMSTGETWVTATLPQHGPNEGYLALMAGYRVDAPNVSPAAILSDARQYLNEHL